MPTSIDDLVQEATEAYQHGNVEAAAALCAMAITWDRRNVSCHLILGIEAVRNAQLREAIHHFLEALETDPTSYEVLNWLSVTHRQHHEIESATGYAQKSIQIDSSRPDGYYNLGMCCLATGEFGAAVSAFKAASKLRPRDATTLFQLANAFLGMNETQEAVEYYRRAIKTNPRNANYLVALGNALNSIKQHKEALQHAEHAIQLVPTSAAAHHLRSQALAGRQSE